MTAEATESVSSGTRPGPEAGPGGAARRLPGTGEIAVRRERLDGMQQAEQLLEALAESGAHGAGWELGGQLRRFLDQVEQHRSSAAAGLTGSEDPEGEARALWEGLSRVDAVLDRHARDLAARLGATQPTALRDALRARRPEPAALRALLEAALLDASDLGRVLAAVEVLVTVLCTEPGEGGTLRVRTQPGSVCARLQEIGSRIQATRPAAVPAAEARLVAAGRRVADGAVEAAAVEVEALRAELGEAVLAPRLLQALVYFDTALWNTLPPPAPMAKSDPAASGSAAEARGEATAGGAGAGRAAAAPVEGRRAGGDPTSSSPPNPGHPTSSSPPAGAGGPPPDEPVVWGLGDRPPPAAPAAEPGAGRARFPLRTVASSVALVAMLCLAAFVWFGGDGGDVRVMTAQELQDLSPRLRTGYRDRDGTGPLFIGTLGPAWNALDAREREADAERIVGHLRRRGVKEVLVYGPDRKVAVHAAPGLPLRIGGGGAAPRIDG